MAVRIGHASVSEKGTVNGAKGDSTKAEVCTRTWYSKPWDFMAIHPDATVREKHASTVEAACENDNIGYGQSDRNTLNTLAKAVGYNLAKITDKCNCDCSTLQNVCAVASGAKGVSYGTNGWTTSNMKTKLKAAGYKIIEDATYLKSSTYCVRGAIYVKSGSHTVCGLDNGSNYKKTLEKAGLSATSTSTTSSKKTESSAAKTVKATEPADKFDKALIGTYTTTCNLNIRNDAGTSKKSLGVLPKGTEVKCYGYYSLSNGVKWLYIQTTVDGVQYTGFCSKAKLKK